MNFSNIKLFKAARAILFSPSASKSAPTVQVSGACGSSKRRGPIGIAKSYQLTEVTPAFLAYVAVVVRRAQVTTFSNLANMLIHIQGPSFSYI
jgi:hypothetical protein